jgi:hypothetical protein
LAPLFLSVLSLAQPLNGQWQQRAGEPEVFFSRHNVYLQHEFTLFTHVPPRGRVRIYTVAGQFVQLLRWGPNDLNGQGDLRLYLLTREGNEFGAGLYLYVMEAMDEAGNSLGVKRGKFVIIS